MGRVEKKKAAAVAQAAAQAKTRHQKFARAQEADARVWRALNPLPQPPKMKHKSYFEAVENTDKKKKLEYKVIIRGLDCWTLLTYADR